MDDPDITAALLAALKRHVQVTLVLTTNPEWESTLMQLQAAGARVVTLGDSTGSLYIHAKAIAADAGTPGGRAYLGSQNFSVASLRYDVGWAQQRRRIGDHLDFALSGHVASKSRRNVVAVDRAETAH